MYVAVVPNRNSPPAILLRESFREHGKVHNRTIANLSHWPPAKIDALRAVLKGATAVGAPLPQAFDIVRSRPHGHVAAVLGTLHKLHLDRLFDKHADRKRDLVLAMIAARRSGTSLQTRHLPRPSPRHPQQHARRVASSRLCHRG